MLRTELQTSGCIFLFSLQILILQINVVGVDCEMFVVGRLIGKLFYHQMWRHSKNLYSHGCILGYQWTHLGSRSLTSRPHSVPLVLLSVPCALKIGLHTGESPSNTYYKFQSSSHHILLVFKDTIQKYTHLAKYHSNWTHSGWQQ